MVNEFDDIRAYRDEDVVPTINRLIENLHFKQIVKNFFPQKKWDEIKIIMKSCKTIKEFQHNIIIKTISDLINRTTKNISSYGIETLEKNKSYTFISNHRDILLDASILCIFLVKKNYETVEIAIGDNLLIYQWIEDIVRLNKSFIVKRTPDFHQLLNVTTHLSKYIHFIINEKKESLWIAQREGRAKNSDDRTQKSILKMLIRNDNTISPEENIKELNLIPVSISYEYDPCDFLKAKEAQQKRDNPKFRKIQKDDFISMKTGLLGYKGNVHIQLGKSINSLLLELKNANIKQTEDKLVPTLARMIDKEIFLNYKFFPINYIAYEKLFGKKNCFIKKYTNNDLKIFKKYLNQQLNKIKLKNKDIFFLKEKILEMYAYPLKNQISVKK